MLGSKAQGFSPWFSVFRDDDDEGGSGASDDDPKGGKPDGDGEKPDDFDYDAWLKEQPEDVRNAITAKFETDVTGLKSALSKEREAREEIDKAKKELERKRSEADEEALVENKKYEELAEKRKTERDTKQAEVVEMTAKQETLQEALDKAEAVLKAYVEEAKKAMKLSAPILELLKPMTPVAQLKWLTAHQEELAAPDKGVLLGSPRETGNGSKMTEDERLQQTAATWR